MKTISKAATYKAATEITDRLLAISRRETAKPATSAAPWNNCQSVIGCGGQDCNCGNGRKATQGSPSEPRAMCAIVRASFLQDRLPVNGKRGPSFTRPSYKRKSAVVPPRGFTWEGILESATIELVKAKEFGDAKRCSDLRQSARIARKNIQAGKAFPVELPNEVKPQNV
jgi:hypothetical protein